MKSIEENTVLATGQMKNSNVIRYYGNSESNYRILIIGNSITRHGILNEIGWPNDFGMAASKEENDYVHLLMKSWDERKKDYLLCVRQAANFEVMMNEKNVDLEDFREIRDFCADIVVFRLAENVSQNIEREYFKESVLSFIDFVNPKKSKVIYTTSFWKNDTVDDVIKELSKMNGSYLVNISDLGEMDEMKAYGKLEHPGIQAHPGDLGMKNIAERIDMQIKELEA